MKSLEKPIIQGEFVIQKMIAKGGWSYVILPHIPYKSKLPFGWNIVRGTIDNFEIKQYKLWPMASNELFLPIKAEIRKKIRKKEGDTVLVVLYRDDSDLIIPEEFNLCLADNALAKKYFDLLPVTSKKQYIDYVMSAKSLGTRAKRMTTTLEKLEKGLKYHHKDDNGEHLYS